ncbi:MAG TPA: MTAP family purine nucleoside phosphorylase [Solirubrobacterales bacterium]|nr:MTAP family purine nucleoside phosphorylase [Solirubrobacterales bacterium]
MGRLAVVLGSNAIGPHGAEIAAAAAEHGAAVVQRHGSGEGYVLPHEVDHAGNLGHLAEQGCDRVLAIASVGSLKPEIGVGSFLCPDDFIALGVGPTSRTDASAHMTPGFDSAWRREVIAAWLEAGLPLRDGGVYWQTTGPRFETAAEIRLLAGHAEVVGMTIGAECTIAAEMGLAYATVCIVDNLANGLAAEPLTVGQIEAVRAENAVRLRDALAAVLPRLGALG